MHFAADLYVDLVEVPAPLAKSTHAADPLPPHLSSKYRPKPVPANIGPNLFHQNLIVSWQRSMPRSNSRSSKFRSDSGYRTYIITTTRITSGDELKQRNGLPGLAPNPRLIHAGYYRPLITATMV
jgi:hypothetical protein